MNVDYDEIVKKILDFWKKYDEKDLDPIELKKSFTNYEIAQILCYKYLNNNYNRVINMFADKINKISNLFNEEEVEELMKQIMLTPHNFKHFSDEKILSFISSYPESANYFASMLSSDDAKIKGFNMIKRDDLKATFIYHLDSDQLKLEYLKKIPLKERGYVISSFKDDRLIEKNIKPFYSYKGRIISKLSDDSKKIYYFKKYFAILTKEDKFDIIYSLKNDEQILHLLKFCNDQIKADIVISKSDKTDELKDKIIQMIKSKKQLATILTDRRISIDLIDKYINRFSNMNELFKIVYDLDDERKIRYLEKFNDKKKIELIEEIYNKKLKFKAIGYIKNKELIFQLISHFENFPEYSDEFENIIDLYCDKYAIDKERLLFVVKNVSLSVLRVIENPNIMKILKSSQENFMKTMQFFNIEKLKMNSSTMNDILNTVLQREFRITQSHIILLFPNLMNEITNKNREILLTKLTEISQEFDINSVLLKNNWTLEQFIDLLLNNNKDAINSLHLICTKFIRYKRNQYIKNNLQGTLGKCTINKYDKNDLMKHIINNYPIELIISYFPTKEGIDYFIKEHNLLKEEEINLLLNNDLIKRIIAYKKNPNNYERIPEDVKNNMRLFNSIFEIIISEIPIENTKEGKFIKKSYEFEEVDIDKLVNIMMNLDIDKMEKTLFNNQELLDKLMTLWNQYKIGGWGKKINLLFENAGISVDAEIIANFIQYFGLSYKSLQEKEEKGEISTISITALLDLAACYSSESKKYSMIFDADNFKYIASNPGPNSATMLKEKRIEKAIQFLKKIRTREYVTVPPIDQDFVLKNGKKMNIVVGNFSNPINLTYGERTGACMRIGGAGESLFDFCLENENGFHIRFSNPNTGKFVSRVSGFRNGNTVFLNQLRYSEDSNYTNDDVVEACKLISTKIIELSKNSTIPIENVVITPYFSMRDSGMVSKDLNISNPQLGMKKFYVDVGSQMIILATSNQDNELVTPKLGIKKVPRYPVKRDKQRILYGRECREYVAHLKSLDQLLSGCKIDKINVEIDKKNIICFAGEDWCITIDEDLKFNEYIMNNTNNRKHAAEEMKSALIYLRQNLEKEISMHNARMGM